MEQSPIKGEILESILIDRWAVTLKFESGKYIQISGKIELEEFQERTRTCIFNSDDMPTFALYKFIGRAVESFQMNVTYLNVSFEKDSMLVISNPKKIPEAAYIFLNDSFDIFVG